MYDADKKVITAGQHLLSLKDLNHSGSIRELAEAGIQSFKIEGRLKEVDYVKNITAFYRKKIDAFLEDKPEFKAASAGKVSLSFDANPVKSFNRGATDYFLNGRSKSITHFESPKFFGEVAGEVTKVTMKYFELETVLDISNNDGLVFIAKSGESVGIKVNVAIKNQIFPDKMNGIYPGAKVYRNYDHRFHQLLKANLTVRKITVKIEISESGSGFKLSACDETGIIVTMDWILAKNPARDPQKSKEIIINQLTKTGDTPFHVSGVETNGTEKYFFQASVLNATRRDLLDRITIARKEKSGNLIFIEPNSFPYPVKEIGV